MNNKNNNYIDEIIKWILYMINWTDKNKKLYMCLNVIMKNARKILPKVQLPDGLFSTRDKEKFILIQSYEKCVLFEVQKHPLTPGEHT